MQTIKLSRKVRADESVMIPADLLNQHIGTQVQFIVQVDWVESGHDDSEPDDELLALVKRIKATPSPPSAFTPATKILTPDLLATLLKPRDSGDSMFDEAAWNAQWDAYERGADREMEEDEQLYLDDMETLFG